MEWWQVDFLTSWIENFNYVVHTGVMGTKLLFQNTMELFCDPKNLQDHSIQFRCHGSTFSQLKRRSSLVLFTVKFLLTTGRFMVALIAS